MSGKLNKCLCISNISLMLYLIYISNRNAKSSEMSFGASNFDNTQGKLQVQSQLSTSTVFEFKDFGKNKSDLIEKGIYWSDLSESFVPKGLSFVDSQTFIKNMRSNVVKTLLPGTWELCGESKNAIASLADRSVMCVRYDEHPQKIYAEVLVFYLSRMLKMDNIPEVVLAKANYSSAFWNGIDLGEFGWSNDETVALIRRVPDSCYSNFVPQIIKDAYLNGKTVTSRDIRSSAIGSPSEIANVMQWGSLIVFDNLIVPRDRLYFWKEYNQDSITEKLHNSVKSFKGKLWLIDNEKSLLHRTIYHHPTNIFTRLVAFHYKWLKTMCVFQSSLIKELMELSTQPSPFQTLLNYTRSFEPLLDTQYADYDLNLIAKLFDSQLAKIIQWAQHCKEISYT